MYWRCIFHEYKSFSHIVYGIKVVYQLGKNLKKINFEYVIIYTCLWYCYKVASGEPKLKRKERINE